jgi:RimJ/RimL family protein N-acetyltransferase
MMRGETVSLAPFERSHLEATCAWANDPQLMRLLDRGRPVLEDEHQRWFASLNQRRDCAYFAIETNADAKHVGNIWLWNIEPRHRKAEVRIVIGDRAHRGHGTGTEAISLLCAHAFTRLHLHKVYAYVLAINARALRAFEKAGFVVEGTLREDRCVDESFTDVYLLGKLG